MATTQTPIPVASTEPSDGSVRGRAIRLGLLGSILILAGGLGAGATLRHDPLLSNTVLGIWRYGHGKMLATFTLYTGVALLVWAWIMLARAIKANVVDASGVVRAVVAWTAPLVLAPPLFTKDPYIYLAQGALANAGFDPYTAGPSRLLGPMSENVAEVWLHTPSPYGPLFIILIKSVVAITGTNILLGVVLIRLLMLSGLALVCAALPGLCRHLGGKPAFALWLVAANPLVLIHLVAGAHNDLLMIGLLCSGTLFVLNRQHTLGFALVGAAFAVKATAAVALPFLVWVWMAHRRDSSRIGSFAITAGAGAAIVVAVFGGFTLLAGVDLGWIGALDGNVIVDLWLSLPTVVGKLVSSLLGIFVDVHAFAVVQAVRLGGWAVLVGVVAWLWWKSREGGPTAIRNAAFALLATVLLSSVTFAWYFSWPLVLGAAFAIPTKRVALIGGLSVLLILFTYPNGDTIQGNWGTIAFAVAASAFAGMKLLRALQNDTQLPLSGTPAHG
ncbi:polyprenol phosphomannose-dependent alpha 1,6 mannosyltransferase MptB [Kibdelosporangium aridum]|uniref:Alpha-1,6-mannosyltransferase n=1 Tax=Kibdelosporangium aridum TaxID=2030 RepID=A0A1W1ZI38_KIBAR|nr:polyprenol phosphomannose-dependent alpha 1,6 mannosyltransferase MptB [Kibdelosporangium aridum]SMC48044.1 alpha-1,6-mannosyltransferase [Kibdelosporangium aridum]